MLPLLVDRRFQVLFHSPHRGTFHLSLTVLVHYRSSGSIQPCEMVLTNSRRVSRVPRYLGFRPEKFVSFHLQDFHLLRYDFPDVSIIKRVFYFPTCPETDPVESHDPEYTTLPGLTYIRFGLIPVRSPLLRKSLLFSLPEVTKMFQFTSFASATYVFSYRCHSINRGGFPHSEISGSKPV